MRRSFGLKFFVAVITALALLIGVGSVLAVIYLGSHQLYTRTPEDMTRQRLEDIAISLGENLAMHYTEEHYGIFPEDYPEQYRIHDFYTGVLEQGKGYYTLLDAQRNVLETNVDPAVALEKLPCFEFTVWTEYPVVESVYAENVTVPDGTAVWEEYPEATHPQEPLHTQIVEHYEGLFRVNYYQGPEITVRIWLAEDAWSLYSSDYWWVVNTMYSLRYWFVLGVILGVAVFLAGISYLTWAVGTKKGREGVKLVGLNKLPLDLYGAAAGGIGFAVGYFAVVMVDYSMDGADLNFAAAFLACGAAWFVALLAITYYCGIVAQFKVGGGHWWRNSIVGRILGLLWKGIVKLAKIMAAVISMLPLIWQWLLIAGSAFLILVITGYLAFLRSSYVRYNGVFVLLLVIELLAGTVLICYFAYAQGILLRGAKDMARGDLTQKVPTGFLFGAFRDMANDLNALADVAVLAAQKQLKSERMKTELITNVSHDIKTPLTSIINFVDLLQKPHTEEQEQEYLEVLDRQSQRMKRLIEDLMELSKATTGNLQVNAAPMDICEAVNQALGEFSDKLDAARLTPVVHRSEGPAMAVADGRLVWRVLSNVLSNAVKYALPGTRIYLDVVRLEDRVLVSVKNISREELKVSTEELMERFVRGDESRNTEGSGLGLNIARSLMELQRGQLQLLVDGDLFKVTLVFPCM